MDTQVAEPLAPGEEESISAYCRDVSRYPRITPEGEQALAARIEQGDAQALQELVRANLRFVIHVAKGFRGQGLPLADLIAEGNAGLVTAARKFDRRRGCRFITYAVWWIRQNILKALERDRTVRVPANVLHDLGRLRRAEFVLAQHLGRAPDLEDVAAQAGLRKRTAAYASGTVSLDAPVHGEDDLGRLDALPDPYTPTPGDALDRQALRGDVRAALSALSERQRLILTLCYGLDGKEPATLREIGERFGISRERVRQLKNDALDRLRHPPMCDRLAVYCK